MFDTIPKSFHDTFSWFSNFAFVKMYHILRRLHPVFSIWPKYILRVKSGKNIMCCGTVTATDIIYVINPFNLLQCFLLSWLYCNHETGPWIYRLFYIAIWISFWVAGCFQGCGRRTTCSSQCKCYLTHNFMAEVKLISTKEKTERFVCVSRQLLLWHFHKLNCQQIPWIDQNLQCVSLSLNKSSKGRKMSQIHTLMIKKVSVIS